jgi:hypothetical protein
MAGGMHSRAGRPLADRTAPPMTTSSHGDAPVPCWISASSELAGNVLGWRRDADGAWVALVAAWVPGERVRRREAGEPL